jgi:hypothetical protein
VSAVPAFATHQLPTVQLRELLRVRLAAEPAAGAPRIGHYGGVDRHRLESLIPAPATRAAVLVPIVDRGDELTVLLTLRALDLKHHAGQISFPGGRWSRATRMRRRRRCARPKRRSGLPATSSRFSVACRSTR